MKKVVVFGMLGTQKDDGQGRDRWKRWRPTVSLCQHPDLPVSRMELLYNQDFTVLARRVADDIGSVSSATEVRLASIDWPDPWDFEQVYGSLSDFARQYPFDVDKEEYLIHVNTGTHVGRICMFLLTESRHFPGKLIQSVPPARSGKRTAGGYRIIDLDLSQYDHIASRFRREQRDARSYLKSGIKTRNKGFNKLIERIERVVIGSPAPLLLTGPTGCGKSLLARRIYDLKKARRLISGQFVEVNSATIRGDAAMSALFGHCKGAFTGAVQAREGLLRAAHGGVLLLDEIGELRLDEQAMLLRALEEKMFLPVGADREVSSDFQLIAATNRDLSADVQAGRFREDLLARINIWTFALPGLKIRPEDIEPNLDYELEQFSRQAGTHLSMNAEARSCFLRFAASDQATWRANFRDLNAAVIRMGTLAEGGRITVKNVEEELKCLRMAWQWPEESSPTALVQHILSPARLAELDRFEAAQLEDVLQVCTRVRTLSEAGRVLFAASRRRKKSANDAHRIGKYLARFGINWQDVVGIRSEQARGPGRES